MSCELHLVTRNRYLSNFIKELEIKNIPDTLPAVVTVTGGVAEGKLVGLLPRMLHDSKVKHSGSWAARAAQTELIMGPTDSAMWGAAMRAWDHKHERSAWVSPPKCNARANELVK